MDRRYLPPALQIPQTIDLCNDEDIPVPKVNWNTDLMGKPMSSSGHEQAASVAACNICKQDFLVHVTTKWFIEFHMASYCVELLWDLGPHTIPEIQAMLQKVFKQSCMKSLLCSAKKHIELGEGDLAYTGNHPCPIATAVLGIVMDLYHLLTSTINTSLPAHVIPGESTPA